jgi:hypothetical protein
MTDSLAIRVKEEECATVAQPLADLVTYVETCTEMDGEVLGEYVERNWDPTIGTALGLMFLVKEMKRRFRLLDRKRQVNGEYKTIRGFKSFDKWFTSVTKKSRRLGYYLLETEEKKNVRNAGRRNGGKKKDTDSSAFVSRCADAKAKLAEIRRRIDDPSDDDEARNVKSLYAQIDPVIDAMFEEFLAVISPDGYEIIQGSYKGWSVSKKDEDEPPSPEDRNAKRSASAKKAAATRATNKAAQTAPAAATPAPSLGECESCCDGTLATEVVGVSEWIKPDGYKYCAKCADDHRKADRKYLIRQMGVQKVMGKFHTIETLVKLGGKVGGDGSDGEETWTMPTVGDYLARVKEKFLGNPRYDQTVVGEYIARLEKKTEATQ